MQTLLCRYTSYYKNNGSIVLIIQVRSVLSCILNTFSINYTECTFKFLTLKKYVYVFDFCISRMFFNFFFNFVECRFVQCSPIYGLLSLLVFVWFLLLEFELEVAFRPCPTYVRSIGFNIDHTVWWTVTSSKIFINDPNNVSAGVYQV